MNKQIMTSYLIWTAMLLISLSACNPKQKPISQNAFSQPETTSPPFVIKAGKPVVHALADNPPP
jgi:hypothetical protein